MAQELVFVSLRVRWHQIVVRRMWDRQDSKHHGCTGYTVASGSSGHIFVPSNRGKTVRSRFSNRGARHISTAHLLACRQVAHSERAARAVAFSCLPRQFRVSACTASSMQVAQPKFRDAGNIILIHSCGYDKDVQRSLRAHAGGGTDSQAAKHENKRAGTMQNK